MAAIRRCTHLLITIHRPISTAEIIADVHTHNNANFPQCLHESNLTRQWLLRGSRPHKLVCEVIESKYLVKSVAMLSPDKQTYGLEVYHSIVNHFAPKQLHYFYLSMKARLLLAAMHFNTNTNKQQAMTKDGELKWQKVYRKAKYGADAVVKAVKEPPSYDYIPGLLEAVLERRETYGSYKLAEESVRDLTGQVPPPLSAQRQPVDKEVLIQRHRSRFN